ncbi:hypothetical protein Cylst_5909 [Cylindrospermum stagnale PCC 7417]|uniref:Uncharacterized protein n=1 Tax=Cylindrospermum stagnale PCC 7417 TaxID=56107 RepID=K9X732_9NOST|nr:hypothetical protein Cylst_5909 [Cylindrospermum stagnale PCC 7417]
MSVLLVRVFLLPLFLNEAFPCSTYICKTIRSAAILECNLSKMYYSQVLIPKSKYIYCVFVVPIPE